MVKFHNDNKNVTEAMKDDLYAWYYEAYPEKPPVWDTLFEVISSSSAQT